MKMLVKSIFVELRSRLRSCSVYITTAFNLNKNCNLRISIKASCLVLYYNVVSERPRRDSVSSSDSFSDDEAEIVQEIRMDEFCHVIPNSMSGLKIEKNSISFRVLTEAVSGGSFYEEQLLLNTNQNSKAISHAPVIDVNVDEEVKIICGNCVNVVSNDGLKFERVLELPSENIDMSEWFCPCSHGHSHKHEITMKSKKCDFLYRLTYFVVGQEILSAKTNKFNCKRNTYHCNRCLAWLGLKNDDKVKLFNSTVKISRENNNDSHIFKYNAMGSNNTSLNDFIFTIEKMAKEFNIGFQYAIMNKLVLECNVSDNKREFLLIWVMDKELQVLRNDDSAGNTGEIKLVSNFLTKILYKVHDSLNEEVETWLSDPTIVSTVISKNMFLKGVEHLQKMSLKVPESFRSTNGYILSYLKV